jgi:hypothetical protein
VAFSKSGFEARRNPNEIERSVNVRDKDGNTPVLATDDDRVALILLRAGAYPHARNNKTALRQQAIEERM